MATKADLERENAALREQVRTLQEALVNALRTPQVIYVPSLPAAAAAPPFVYPVYPGTAMPPITIYDRVNVCAGAAAPPCTFTLSGDPWAPQL